MQTKSYLKQSQNTNYSKISLKYKILIIIFVHQSLIKDEFSFIEKLIQNMVVIPGKEITNNLVALYRGINLPQPVVALQERCHGVSSEVTHLRTDKRQGHTRGQ